MKKLLLTVIVVVFITVSCGPDPVQKDGRPLFSAVIKHQNDIPVPVNFTYITDKSRIEQFASFRLCEMLYESGKDARHGLNALQKFYLKLMPSYQWTSLKNEKRGKRVVMIFKKDTAEDEFCRLEIYRNGDKSIVYVLIGNEKLVKAEK